MPKKKKNWMLIVLGLGLIAFAIIPTPDDATVISPILAFIGGAAFVAAGMNTKIKIPLIS